MVEVWFFYIISAVAIFGFNAIVDKIILTRHLNSFSYLVAGIPSKVVYLVAIMFFVPLDFTSPSFYLAFLAGFLGVLGYYAYAFAMKKEEASRISALTSLYPLFVAIFAAIFLNEFFSAQSYVGIIFMILGATMISYKRSKFHKIIPFVIIFIAVIANFFWGVEQVISKISLNSYGYWQFIAFYLMGIMFATLLSLAVPNFRKSLMKEFKKLERNTIILLVFSPAIWFVGIILFFYAATLGPITLVSTLSITAPFAVLLFTIFLSVFWPKILKEEIDRKTVALKLLAVVLIFLGTYLITA